MNDEIINGLYARLMDGVIDRRQFEEAIFFNILSNYSYYGIRDRNRENRADFVSWMYPRLRNAFSRYCPQRGVAFCSFLHSVIRMGYKEYKSCERRHSAVETAYWLEKAKDTPVCEDETEYFVETDGSACTRLLGNLSQRQALVLLLKSYYSISEELVNDLQPLLGIDKEVLGRMLEDIRTIRAKRDVAIRELRDRCQSQHFRCLTYERRLRITESGTIFHNQLSYKLELNRSRLYRMRNRLKGMRLSASNKQIAGITGIPKGTVDSLLHNLKQKYRDHQDKMA